MRIIVSTLCFLFLQCQSINNIDSTDEHYKIINNVLDTYVFENPNKNNELKKMRINPVFSELYPSSNFSSFELLKTVHLYGSKERKVRGCDNFLIPIFEVDSHLDLYKKQLSLLGTAIDFKKIGENYISYKTSLEDPKNIKLLDSFHSTNMKVPQEVLKERRRKQLLHKENGYFEISYPIISFNNKEAIILISSHKIGQTLWFYEKINGKWKKQCDRNIGTIN